MSVTEREWLKSERERKEALRTRYYKYAVNGNGETAEVCRERRYRMTTMENKGATYLSTLAEPEAISHATPSINVVQSHSR